MNAVREKMVELIKQIVIPFWAGQIADHLISNDVVPVVRCKDCLYYETGKDYMPYCNHPDGGIADYPRESDFCSYGERKDGEG